MTDKLELRYIPLGQIARWSRNAKRHDLGAIIESIRKHGFKDPMKFEPALNDGTGGIVEGNGRDTALVEMYKESPDSPPRGIVAGEQGWLVPVLFGVDAPSQVAAEAYAIDHNNTAIMGGDADLSDIMRQWDNGLMDVMADLANADELPVSIDGDDYDILINNNGDNSEPSSNNMLFEQFVIPPFTILDTRQGYWQERKQAWTRLGIQSELGRGVEVYNIGDKKTWDNSKQAADKISNLNNAPIKPSWATGTGTTNRAPGTSIFDPVLCELIYTWCTAKGAKVIDPFAGGSVRGIVAAYLGRQYTGIDLRSEQVEENARQAKNTVPDNAPHWIVGDSRKSIPDEKFDFIFSCPPYADLEVYSDDPRDISTMDYADFIKAYRSIINSCVAHLNDNRFACFVVGEIRDKHGGYRNFVSDTIKAFIDAGCQYYNEAILVTAAGSLPIRVGRQFRASRKLGKTHQNVLVFVKGDAKIATKWCGNVAIGFDAETP